MRGAALALVLGLAACGDDDGGAVRREFEEAKILIEHNGTAMDTGFQGFVDGDPWDKLEITGPGGTIFRAETQGSLKGYGLTELFFETQEPPNSRVPIADVLARVPEGSYRFAGVNIDGERVEGTATMTHAIPAVPQVLTPAEDAVVDPAALVVSWAPVTTTLSGAPVEIVGYELIVEKDAEPATPPMGFASSSMSVHVPPSVTSLTVPVELLERNAPYKLEVLALEVSGNQTIAELSFSTMP